MRNYVKGAAASILCLVLGTSHGVDLSDPGEAATTWVRLKGDTAGRVTYEWMTGTAYGVPADENSQALFRIESVTVRQSRQQGVNAYEERNFACRLYRDVSTNQYISTMQNPYTKETVDLQPGCNSGLAIKLSKDGMSLLSDMNFTSTGLDRPMEFEVIDAGDHIIIRREAHSKFVRRDGEVRREMAVDTFKLPAEELNDEDQTALFPAYSWISNTEWMTTLGMGDRPGHMIWSINGRKYMNQDELPAAFKAALERQVPGALERSIDWD